MKLEEEIKQKKFNSPQHKAAVNILFTSNWLQTLHCDCLKKQDITMQQYNVLRILRGQHPDAASIKLIKERMLDKMSDSSRIVEKLRLKGLVKRDTCANDRRSVDVIITEKGLKLLKKIDPEIKKVENAFSVLSEQEVNVLNELLDKLRG